MGQKPIILPFDGYMKAYQILFDFRSILRETGTRDLIGFVKGNDFFHCDDMPGPVIMRALGKIAVEEKADIGVFLDLKLADVKDTVMNTAKHYADSFPGKGILTVSDKVNGEGFLYLRRVLPNVKLALLSVLTDMKPEDCAFRWGHYPDTMILHMVRRIQAEYEAVRGEKDPKYALDLIVCSANEVAFLRQVLGFTYGYVCPGIRDRWMTKGQQKRTAGARWALNQGATYLVMGAQMTKGNPGEGVTAQQSRQMTMDEIKKSNYIEIIPNDPIAILTNCDGYYESPVGSDGKHKGPLVAYAGDYVVDDAGQKKNFVGFIYYNFARAEQYPLVRDYFARQLAQVILDEVGMPDVVIGAPMGGIMMAVEVGRILGCRTIFAEKKVTALADPNHGKKEQSELIIDRHDIKPGDGVVIIEDVINNLSTPGKLIGIIKAKDGNLLGLAAPFSRSQKTKWEGLPVAAGKHQPLEQFKQDDPTVADLIAQDKIVLKPKQQWVMLKAAMENKEE
ncbi:MAG: orotidine 5'-phosphate decarboxylase / HUMPS family protein [Candidatus Falkowbacteria bacterium]